jgi:hypothetical protein
LLTRSNKPGMFLPLGEGWGEGLASRYSLTPAPLPGCLDKFL